MCKTNEKAEDELREAITSEKKNTCGELIIQLCDIEPFSCFRYIFSKQEGQTFSSKGKLKKQYTISSIFSHGMHMFFSWLLSPCINFLQEEIPKNSFSIKLLQFGFIIHLHFIMPESTHLVYILHEHFINIVVG